MTNTDEAVFTTEDLKKFYKNGGPSQMEIAGFIARRSKEYEQLLGVYADSPDFGRSVGDPYFIGMTPNGKGEWIDAYRVDVCVDKAGDKWERRLVPFDFVFSKEEFTEKFNQAKPDTAEFDILLVVSK